MRSREVMDKYTSGDVTVTLGLISAVGDVFHVPDMVEPSTR